MQKYNERGEEMMDPTPIAVPLWWKRPPTLQEQIRGMIRSEELRKYAEASGHETFEEAEDFEVGDDFDPTSPWEESFEGQFDHEVKMEAKLKEAKTPRRKASAFEEEMPLMQVAKGAPTTEKTSGKTSSSSDES